jgi:monoamine oxidase
MPTTVAIIGAGCAGLGAAATLLNQPRFDLDVTLIEANGWIGGRAVTAGVSGVTIDLGPQFIQDPDINPWTGIMRSLGIEGVQPKIDALYRRQLEDKSWETVEFNTDISAMDDRLERQYREATGYANMPAMPVGSAEMLKKQQDLRLSVGSNALGPIAESAEPWQYLASDRERQSDGAHGSNIYVKGGLGNLVAGFGQELQKNRRLKVNLGAAVVSIEEKKKIFVGFSDETEEKYDFCIVTIPVGEQDKVKFDPPLSGPRTRASSFIALGSYKKVAFRPKAFPLQDPDSIKPGFEYYIYDDTQDAVWQYFRLPTNDSTLICVAAGDFARALDAESDQAAASSVIALLSRSYPEADFTPIPDEEAVLVTNWTAMPFIHGAYSYTRYNDRFDADNAIGLEARLRLAEPHGRIHFAGEATWPDAYGTIHGAYFSGERAANEILAILRG